MDDFDEFYRATSRRTLQYAHALTADPTMAQDLTQEAYVRAWQRWSRLRGYERPEAWVRLIVSRLCTDGWRRLGRYRRIHARLRPPDPAPPPSIDTVLLTDALKRLPFAQRRALSLHYLLDLSVADVAAETGVSVGTVKSWLSRGRAALAQDLAAPATSAVPHGGRDAA